MILKTWEFILCAFLAFLGLGVIVLIRDFIRGFKKGYDK